MGRSWIRLKQFTPCITMPAVMQRTVTAFFTTLHSALRPRTCQMKKFYTVQTCCMFQFPLRHKSAHAGGFLNSCKVFVNQPSSSLYRFMQTTTDSKMSRYLDEKIGKERLAKPIKLQDFNMKTDEANVSCFRTYNDEQISLVFNINGKLSDDKMLDGMKLNYSGDYQGHSNMISYPVFTICISKGDTTPILVLQCKFPPENPYEADAYDFLDIAWISIIERNGQINFHCKELPDLIRPNYTADGGLIDDKLHKRVLKLLKTRGMGENFFKELKLFCIEYEQLRYVEFMQSLFKWCMIR